MTQTSTWIVLIATIVIGIVGLFMAAHGEGLFAFVGWLVVAFGLLVGIATLRRLANQANPEH